MNEGVSPDKIRAGNVDRERVIEVLRSAVEDGRLDIAEFEERANRVYSARTLGELPAVTEDLLPSADQPIQLHEKPVAALFTNDARGGRWVVPDALPVMAVFGTADLDLRTALLAREHTTMYASAVFGRIHVHVPDGVEVRVRGLAFLGVRNTTARPPQRRDAPVLEIRGFSLFGSLRVRAPKRRSWLPWRRGQREELE